MRSELIINGTDGELSRAAASDGLEPDETASPSAAMKFCIACGLLKPADQPCVRCAPRAASPAPEATAPPRLAPALSMYFSTLGLLLVAPAFFEGPIGDLVTCLCMSLMVLGFTLVMRRELRPALMLPDLKWCAAATVLAPCTFAIAHAAVLAGTKLFGVPDVKYLNAYIDAGYGWPVIVLLVCLQPAVVEELACRGVMFAALRRVMGPVETIIVSAFMFMALHLSPVCWPHLFVMGLALGYLRHRSGSLLPGVILHFLHNSLAVVMGA